MVARHRSAEQDETVLDVNVSEEIKQIWTSSARFYELRSEDDEESLRNLVRNDEALLSYSPSNDSRSVKL